MLKLTALIACIPVVLGMSAADAAILGPYASSCHKGSNKPAILVHIEGLKNRDGLLRVQAYDAVEKSYFEKGQYVQRVEIEPPATGSVDICLPVAKSGAYTVLARHDINKNGHIDHDDGGGFSGNPSMSLMDVALKHKPSLKATTISVGNSISDVTIIMKYVQGLSFKPIAASDEESDNNEVKR